MATEPGQTNIPAQLVKELRERTGAGFTACREALIESKGDIEQAISILRKKGQAAAQKNITRRARIGTKQFAAQAQFLDQVAIAGVAGKLCGPVSKRKPSFSTAPMRPPACSEASNRVTGMPSCWSRQAHAKPEMPAPITATCVEWFFMIVFQSVFENSGRLSICCSRR